MANYVNDLYIAGDLTDEDLAKISELVMAISPVKDGDGLTIREQILESSISFDREHEDEFVELIDYLKEQRLSYNIDGFGSSDDNYYTEYWRPGMPHSDEVIVDEDGVPELCELSVKANIKNAIDPEKAYTGAEVIALLDELFTAIPPLPKTRIIYPKGVDKDAGEG